MKILLIGDVTSPRAALFLRRRLWGFRRKLGAELVILNGENAGFIIGPTPETAETLLEGGADVITGGNHTLQNYALLPTLEEMQNVLRPANYPSRAPGQGYTILDVGGVRVLVMSLLGRVHIEPPLNSPFETADRILSQEAGRYDLAVVDFHAEATGEKLALGHYLDGRVAVLVGTHTHVPTADLQILPGGTGYVTDLGMTGAVGSILGIRPDMVIDRYLTAVNHKLQPADGPIAADCVLFTVDPATGKTTAAERLQLRE